MSKNENSPIPGELITRPSLAELRTRLLEVETLPEARRRDMASALASLAKALGRPAEAILADPRSLRPLLAGLTPAMVGLKADRWRNVLSLTGMAMAHAGPASDSDRHPFAALWRSRHVAH